MFLARARASMSAASSTVRNGLPANCFGRSSGVIVALVQTPCRSGLPSAVRATGAVLAPLGGACCAITEADTMAASPSALPWWIRATAQPTGVLTVVLAGVAVWFAPQLRAAGAATPAWGAELLARAAGLAAPMIQPITAYLGRDPLVDTGIALAILPLVGVLSFGLFRLGHLIATPRASRS